MSIKELIKELYQLFDVDPKFLTRTDFFKLIEVIKKISTLETQTYTKEEIDAMFEEVALTYATKDELNELKPLIYAGL